MHPNHQLIQAFYQAFQNKNPEAMKACYSEKVVFNDAAFTNLDYMQTAKMWEMLIKRGKDLELEFEVLTVDDHKGSAKWVPTYTFSQTGRKVVNHITASFEFAEGKIVKHTDDFNFYRWARQAFGPLGLAIGWTPFFQNKVRTMAMKSLKRYMEG